MLSFYEMICFAKVYNAAIGITTRSSVSKQEIDIAFEVIKKMADNRYGWSQQQKDMYKILVDYCKQAMEQN